MNFEIKVLRGEKLIAKDITGTSDSFLRCYLVDYSGKVVKDEEDKKREAKSHIITDLNPQWNWLAFTITSSDIAKYSIKYIYFSVWDEDVTTEEFMGKAKLTIKDIKKNTQIGKSFEFKLDLLPRDGKKDKVKGCIIVECTSLRTNFFGRSDSQISRKKEMNPNRASIHNAIGTRGTTINSDLLKMTKNFCALPEFDHSRSDAEFSSIRALWFTSFSQLAYKNYPITMFVLRNIWGMKKARFFENFETDTQGFGAYNDKLLILSFRGTESKTDLLTDLNVLPTSPFPNHKSIRVHKGFNLAYSSVRSQVERFVKRAMEENKDLKIYCCGHSLGGALATLAVAYFTLNEPKYKISALYTIGQPKVGNREFVQYFRNVLPCFRIINQTDPIPLIGYGSHYGREVYINSKGHLTLNIVLSKKQLDKAKSHLTAISNKNIANFLENHTSGQYRKWVEAFLQRDIIPCDYRNYVIISTEDLNIVINEILHSVSKCRHFRSFYGEFPMNEIQNLKPYLKTITPELTEKFNLNDQLEIESILATLYSTLELFSIKMKEYAEKSTVFSNAELHIEFTKSARKFALSAKYILPKLISFFPAKNSMLDYSFVKIGGFFQNFLKSTILSISNLFDAIHSALNEKRTDIARTKLSDASSALKNLEFEEFSAYHSYLSARLYFLENDPTQARIYLENILKSPAIVEISQIIEKDDKFQKDIMNFQEKFPELLLITNKINATKEMFENEKKKLSDDEIEKLTKLFDVADNNGDRFLTADELEQYIQSVGINDLILLSGTKLRSDPAVHFQNIITRIKSRSQQKVGIEEFLYIMSLLIQFDSENSDQNLSSSGIWIV